jgi:putative heme transporter
VLQATPDIDLDDVEVRPAIGRHPVLRVLIGVVLGTAVVAVALPHLLGTDVASVVASLSRVSAVDVVVLSIVWLAGLVVHSFVLTGALPGLTRTRALMLNLTGSAVSNVLPFGGAAATAVNFKMARSWGVGVPAFAAFALIANVWWIVVKLALPLCGVAVLAATGTLHSASVWWAAAASVVGLAVIGGAVATIVCGRADRAVRLGSQLLSSVAARLGRPWAAERVTATIAEVHEDARSVIASRWRQLTAGTVGYAALQAVLLAGCLQAVGAGQNWHIVFAAYAVDRVLTLAVFMPGAAGIADLGTAAVLVALGGAAAPTAAGVLLYRAFTFGIEIPVGGGWLCGWLAASWLRRPRPGRAIVVDAADGAG